MPDLGGLTAATVLPMTKRAEPDLDALKAYIRWMKGHRGLVGFAVNVDTGEGSHLTQKERDDVLGVYSKHSAPVKIVAGVTARYTAEAKAMAESAESGGADALLIFPPPAFSGTPLPPEIVADYHKAIAGSVSIPLLAFQLYSQLGGVDYSPEVLRALTSLRQVCGIKDASSDYGRFLSLLKTCRQSRPGFQVLTGNDTFILESLVAGADGALVGFGTIAVQQQIDMIRHVKREEYKSAQEVWKSMLPLVDAVFAPPARDYRARLKEALVQLGIIPLATVRPPLMDLSQDAKSRISHALKEAGLLP
ncbi:MAG: dihydrodipicolinate synthase family protein [Nitrososphaerota archaeon]|nr:dihydrodipicolinate synthase family protein [Nitrososphaerota archaeon]